MDSWSAAVAVRARESPGGLARRGDPADNGGVVLALLTNVLLAKDDRVAVLELVLGSAKMSQWVERYKEPRGSGVHTSGIFADWDLGRTLLQAPNLDVIVSPLRYDPKAKLSGGVHAAKIFVKPDRAAVFGYVAGEGGHFEYRLKKVDGTWAIVAAKVWET